MTGLGAGSAHSLRDTEHGRFDDGKGDAGSGMKTILFLLDGVGDRGQPVLGGLTPLQAANCPNLDRLAAAGETGLMFPLDPGIPLGTDHAHYLLFGYQPEEYPGRAVIDAMGEGLSLNAEDLILRTSWATVRPEGAHPPREGYRRFLIQERFTPGVGQAEAHALAESLPESFEGIRAEWHFSHDSHGFLILRDAAECFDASVSDTDPFYEGQYVMGSMAFETDAPGAARLADWINRYLLAVHHRLEAHPLNRNRRDAGMAPANFMLTKWAGRLQLPEAFHLRNGMEGAVIGASKLLKGVAKSLGMAYVHCEDYTEAVGLAHELPYAYIHVHTKAPDTAAHTKNPHQKVSVIEALDHAFEGLEARRDVLYVITGDHSTASSGSLIHSGESVPVVFLGTMTRRDLGSAFNEVACGLGGLRIRGKDLMPIILNLTDRAKLYHLRAGAVRRFYRARYIPPLEDR